MEVKVTKVIKRIYKRPMLWIGIIAVLILGAAVVQAALPSISLNSPASFPVDI